MKKFFLLILLVALVCSSFLYQPIVELSHQMLIDTMINNPEKFHFNKWEKIFGELIDRDSKEKILSEKTKKVVVAMYATSENFSNGELKTIDNYVAALKRHSYSATKELIFLKLSHMNFSYQSIMEIKMLLWLIDEKKEEEYRKEWKKWKWYWVIPVRNS